MDWKTKLFGNWFDLKDKLKSEVKNGLEEDQGIMFGYATDETEECMPLTVTLSHALNRKISDMRRDGTLWWARPDSKTQVGNINSILNLMHFIS